MNGIIVDNSGRYSQEVANVHLSAFPNFFLSTLGNVFLQTYYKNFAKHKDAILVVNIENDEITGFGAMAKECRGFNKSLILSAPMEFGWRLVVLMFTKPLALVRLAKNMRKTSNSVADNGDYAELYSIGTKKGFEGKGIGTAILGELESMLKNDGCERVSLTTDYDDNDATLGFYKKNGYNVLYEFTTYPNRRMYRLIKELK